MGVLASVRCEKRETLLLVELESVERRACLVCVRRYKRETIVEFNCYPEEGVRIDGKLAFGLSVLMELGDNMRVEYGSEVATIRYAGRDADDGCDLEITSSSGAEVRRVQAARFDNATGKVAVLA